MTEDEKIIKDQPEEAVQDSEAAEPADNKETAEAADTAAEETAAENAEDAQPEAAEGTEAAGSEDTAQNEASKSDKKDKQIAELNDKYKRLFAEFDNYRKRTENEKLSMFSEGEKTVILKVLPLIDNFERALSTIPEDQKGTALAEGIEKVYKAFSDQLTAFGVTAIEAVNQPFDANLHNAVMHVEDESLPENTVVEELQKGYMFKDKVIRYSMVKVAN